RIPVIANSRCEASCAEVGKVACAFKRSWNRGQERCSCPQTIAFITEKGEGLVLDGWTTDRGSKLILNPWWGFVLRPFQDFCSLVEKFVGVESLVTQVFVGGAVPCIGARLRTQVDNAARKLAPLGTKIVVLDLKLGNRILSRNQKWQVNV